MAVKILHKRSAVQFKNATGAQVELGELAINYHESGPRLQVKNTAGEIVQVGGVYFNAAGGDAPGDPLEGALWVRGDSLFIFDGTTWIEIAGGGGGGGGTITVIGGDGIEATTIGTTVTVTADLDTSRGLEIVGDAIAVKLGTGLDFDADGKIECTISGGLTYKGTVDVTSTTIPTATQGDLYANTGKGKFSSDWGAVTSNADTTTDANPGDWMIYQGAQWDHIPVTVVGTDLGIANRDATDLDVTSSTGADATIPAATTSLAGLMTAADKNNLDDLVTEDPKNQDLSYKPDGQNAGTVEITGGTDAVIPIATSAQAGLFTGTEKDQLAALVTEDAKNQDLSYKPDGQNAGTVEITHGTDAVIPIATSAQAGLFTGTEKDKLAGIEAGAAANQDLSYKPDGQNAGTVEITNGTDAVIPIATSAQAGLFTGTEKDKLAGLNTNTQNDDRYLRVDSGAPDQIRIKGEANFRDSISVGPNKECELNVNGSATFGAGGANNVYIYGDGSADFEGLTTHKSGILTQDRITGPAVFNIVTPGGSATGNRFGLDEQNSGSPAFTLNGKAIASSSSNAINLSVNYNSATTQSATVSNIFNQFSQTVPGDQDVFHNLAISDSNKQNTSKTYAAYASRLNADDNQGAGETYAFYAEGSAPNFLAGSTYIGGTNSRNTFELWKSTLTEEQLEQLEAGTLVAPANVSVPGDGEFARQWWYDQQSAEDQALIDSGELDYPEHLAAATFTDTFALGDKTNINLNSRGLGEFKGGVRLTGGTNTDVNNGFLGNASGNFVQTVVDGVGVARAVKGPGGAGQFTFGGTSPKSSTMMSVYAESVRNGIVCDLRVDADETSADLGQGSQFSLAGPLTGTTGGTINFYTARLTNDFGAGNCTFTGVMKGYFVPSNFGALNTSGEVYGFYSEINQNNKFGDAAKNYNFYAEGNAPSFFQGLTEHEGGIKLPNIANASSLATDANGNVIAGSSGGGGLTQTEGDNRYLRVDADAGDQIRISGEANFRDSISVGPNKECELNVNGSATFGAGGANNVYIYGDGSADFIGDVKVGSDNSKGVVLTSPNGTAYRLVVADDGTLSTTAV